MKKNAPFYKMNGIGNEIIVLDMRDQENSLSEKALSKLQKSITFDQLMIIDTTEDVNSDFFINIINYDLSYAKTCGNGIRCVAEYLYQKNHLDRLVLMTPSGVVTSIRYPNGLIRIDMGKPQFRWNQIPLKEKMDTKLSLPISYRDLSENGVVSIGNPHIVFWTSNLSTFNLLTEMGPLIENHTVFPEGVNVTIAKILSVNEIRICTWERGVGLTKACGSAACATAVLSHKRKGTARSVKILSPGGELQIDWNQNDMVQMVGPTEFEYETTMSPLTGDFE